MNISEIKGRLFDKVRNNNMVCYSFDIYYYMKKFYCLNVKIYFYYMVCRKSR